MGAAWARLHDKPVPDDIQALPGVGAEPPLTLFDPDRSTLPPDVDRLDALVKVHADQRRRVAELPEPVKFALLAALESAGALAAVEMAQDGLPWCADVHDEILTAAGGTMTSQHPIDLAVPAKRGGIGGLS